MLFIGNDVVDLTDPENIGKSRDQRFVRRVFTLEEEKIIRCAADSDRILWILWAGKEVAYKIVQKINQCISSIPRLYRVHLAVKQGAVCYGNVETPICLINIKTFSDKKHVQCVGIPAIHGKQNKYFWKTGIVAISSPYEMTGVRDSIVRCLADYLHLMPDKIDIRKNKETGIPYVYIHGIKSAIDISFSHDGRFFAWAFCADMNIFRNTIH